MSVGAARCSAWRPGAAAGRGRRWPSRAPPRAASSTGAPSCTATSTDDLPLGSLHSHPIHVVADDGVPLHAEVDAFDPESRGAATPYQAAGRAAGHRGLLPRLLPQPGLLALPAGGLPRPGHGRSTTTSARTDGPGARPSEHATIDQLGRDLKRVLDDLTHDDPVVLVGHSMGGMTILSLAEQHPELFGTQGGRRRADRHHGRRARPGPDPVPDAARRAGQRRDAPGGRHPLARAPRRRRAAQPRRTTWPRWSPTPTPSASEVPDELVDFVYDLLNQTPFEVVADFFPAFATLDSGPPAPRCREVPTSIIGGTSDKITAIGHARKLHARIHGSDLLECDGAGHMVIIERYAQVNAELDQLFAHAVDRVGAR